MKLPTKTIIHTALAAMALTTLLFPLTTSAADVKSALDDRDILIHIWPDTGDRITVYGRLERVSPHTINQTRTVYLPIIDDGRTSVRVKAAQLAFGHEDLSCQLMGSMWSREYVSEAFTHTKSRKYLDPSPEAYMIECKTPFQLRDDVA